MKLILIGSGNVAFHLAKAFVENNINLCQIYGRNQEELEQISTKINVPFSISGIEDADVYIIAVSDEAVEEVSALIHKKDCIVAHTSGSLPKEILEGEFTQGDFVPAKISDKIIRFIYLNKELKPFYLFIDTETTGLFDDSIFEKHFHEECYLEEDTKLSNLLNSPRLVRLSYIIQDKQRREMESKDFIIRPTDFIIPTAASKIHGITTEKAKREGWPIKTVLEHFRTVCASVSKIVGHNASFDHKVISTEFLRNSIHHNLPDYFLDTMFLSSDFCAFKGKYGIKYPKLSELHYKLFGKNFDGAHDSSIDVAITAKCFWELKRLGIIK